MRMIGSSRLPLLSILLLSIFQPSVHSLLSTKSCQNGNGHRIRLLTTSGAYSSHPRKNPSEEDQGLLLAKRPSTAGAGVDANSSEDPFSASGGRSLVTTVKGGLANIFEFAEEQKARNKRRQELRRAQRQKANLKQGGGKEQPRWHPYSGINSSNPNFRTAAPVMTNAGFAKSIWRNARKRNKPVLWENSLRTYDRMAILEQKTELKIKRTNLHHEGAMLACAKLGWWQKCLEIYHFVNEQDSSTILPPTASSRLAPSNLESSAASSKIVRRVYVTDNMIQSLVRACSRASSQRGKGGSSSSKQQQQQQQQQANSQTTTTSNADEQESLEEQEVALRRIPLDTALEIVRTMDENHGVKPGAIHVNPLAAAYQSLGYTEEARDILQTMLSNRTAGEEPEEGVDILNVHDLCAKDKGSYSLLVQGAVGSGDWGAAVEALCDMTKSGLYPNPRHCNSWNEIAERHRGRSSKKKIREEFWTNSVI
ncbi:unnamed protein product [Cylindrotheca closterium]|uniref:Pentacotripeptide-repeat region of PRORP domain-containing protein n=1 Tax=Cylindrotheca closterium TaxID=2856 RepID=A0AAD2FQJ8_9STRA|nr:unnamed protein product [Cylindrotheca closterium]